MNALIHDHTAMPNDKFEYCALDVALYREGTGGEPRELLHIRLPGAQRASVSNAFGSVGMLNQLGGDGWELVDVEAGTFWLKRQKDPRARLARRAE